MLDLENISKSYNYKLILKNINLSLKPASINLLVGANGSGKSTLLKIIAGLTPYDQNPKAKVQYAISKAQIAYLAHNSSLYSSLSAYENLKFWSNYQGLNYSQTELEAFLDRVNLKKFSQELVATFSRGMLQRMNLARILLQKAQLILLDEPATGLDLESKELLDREILLAKEAGACVLWISHDLQKDQSLADNIFRIENKSLAGLAGLSPAPIAARA